LSERDELVVITASWQPLVTGVIVIPLFG